MTTFRFILSLGLIISYLQIAKSTDTWDAFGMLPDGYNKLLPPSVNGSVVNVNVSLDIARVLDVNMVDQTFKINCHLKQSWREPRIKFPDQLGRDIVFLGDEWYKNLWRPSTYFFNAIDGSDLDLSTLPMLVELERDGTVVMMARITVTLTCDMNMVLYPHDAQSCFIQIQSLLSESANEVRYEWDTMQIDELVDTNGFQVDHIQPETGFLVGEDQDVHSRYLRGHFQLHRQVGHYVIRVYAPSFLIVITAFVGFWMPTQAYPARTIIVVIPMMSLITLQSQVNRDLMVSYVVALDIWYMMCTLFIFMCLVELAAALVYKHTVEDKIEEQATKPEESAIHSISGSVESMAVPPPPSLPTLQVPAANVKNNLQRQASLPSRIFHIRRHSHQHSKSGNTDTEANHDEQMGSIVQKVLRNVYGDIEWFKAPGDRNKIDYCARIIFPITFIHFCLFYAVYLMQ
ncbi:Glycine receptor subunit beta [Halotydeus destructor]|nr:Glycine receptor subunit beta [Halotydeus destructor]